MAGVERENKYRLVEYVRNPFDRITCKLDAIAQNINILKSIRIFVANFRSRFVLNAKVCLFRLDLTV